MQPQPATIAWLGGTDVGWNAGLASTPGAPAVSSLPEGVQVKSAAVSGDDTILAIGTDGNLYAWGYNATGAVGDGTYTNVAAPERISLPGGVAPVEVAGGTGASYAIGDNGELYATGLNNYGQLGDANPNAGTNLDFETAAFQQVALPSGVKATSVAAANDFALAVGSDGNVYAWGVDFDGQLGDGTYEGASTSTPQVVPLPSGVTPVSVQASETNGFVLTSAGTVYSWGENTTILGNTGAEGSSSSVSGPVAVQMPGGVTVSSFSVADTDLGGAALAIGSDGSLYGWGPNQAGELGDGTESAEPTPEKLALPGDAKPGTVSAAPDVSYVIDSSGQIYAAGLDAGYDLGATTAGDGAAAPNFQTVAQPQGFVATNVYSDGCTGEGYDPAAACVAVIATGAFTDAPFFTADSPPSSLAAGASIDYTFAAGGDPAPTFALASGAPSWLSINATTGELTGTAPAGYGYARYSVLAQSSAGTTAAGPFFISDPDAQATVSGTVSGINVYGTRVEVCLEGGNSCSATVVGADGSYSLQALIGTTITITAYPPQDRTEAEVSISGLVVPAGGLSDENLTLTSIASLPADLGLASVSVGQASGSVPQMVWTDSTRVTYSGCPYGAGTVSVIGRDGGTGPWDSNTYALTESPVGSGDYFVILPPQYPFHGPVEITSQISCPTGSDGFLPSSGSTAGGTTVWLLGSGFTGATSVRFGSTAAAGYTVLTDRGIEAVAPPGDGNVPVTVTTPSGTQTVGDYDYAPNDQGAGGQAALGSPSAVDTLAAAVAEINPALVAHFGGGTLQSLAQGALQGIDLCAAGKAVVEAAIEDALQAAAGPIIDDAIAAAVFDEEAVSAFTFPPAALIGMAAAWGAHSLADHALAALASAAADTALENAGCPPGDVEPNALVDPSGNVLDTNGNPVSGATVTILRSDAFAGPFTAVDPSSAGIEPDVNPELTGVAGTFMWDVAAGYYQVQAAAPGCTSPLSSALDSSAIGPLPVPPPQTGLVITMACAGEAPAPTPTVTGLSVAAGPEAGGTQVQVWGTGFTPSSSVSFGGTPAGDVAYLSPTTLEATTPAGAGIEDVRVQTAGGTSATSAADEFFFGVAPTVTGLSVDQGSTLGGTSVTITGSGFTGATIVGFGGLPAHSYSVMSDSEIKAVTSPSIAGRVNVIVASPAGPSAFSSAAQFTFVAPPVVAAAAHPAFVRLAAVVKVSARGRLRLKASCPAHGSTCVDTVSLRATVKTKRGKRKAVTIASHRLKLAAGKTSKVRFKLSRAGLSQLKKAKRHKLKVTAVIKAGSQTRERRLTLKLV